MSPRARRLLIPDMLGMYYPAARSRHTVEAFVKRFGNSKLSVNYLNRTRTTSRPRTAY